MSVALGSVVVIVASTVAVGKVYSSVSVLERVGRLMLSEYDVVLVGSVYVIVTVCSTVTDDVTVEAGSV